MAVVYTVPKLFTANTPLLQRSAFQQIDESISNNRIESEVNAVSQHCIAHTTSGYTSAQKSITSYCVDIVKKTWVFYRNIFSYLLLKALRLVNSREVNGYCDEVTQMYIRLHT
jgi:hypothetical protein